MKKINILLTVITMMILSTGFCFASENTICFNDYSDVHKIFNESYDYYVTEDLTTDRIDLLFNDSITASDKTLAEVINVTYNHAMNNGDYYSAFKISQEQELDMQKDLAKTYIKEILGNHLLETISNDVSAIAYSQDIQKAILNLSDGDKDIIAIYKEYFLCRADF